MSAETDQETATIGDLWGMLREGRAQREAQAAELAQLEQALGVQPGGKDPWLFRLEQLGQRPMTRAGLLKGMAITAAGAAVAGLSLDDFSPALAAGPSPGSAVKPTLVEVTLGYGYQTFAGLDFMPDNSPSGWTWPGGGSLSISPTAFGAYFTVLDLPQGATVQEVLFFVLNNSSSGMVCEFAQMDPTADRMSDTSSVNVGQNGSMQTVTVPSNGVVVDNSQGYYVLAWYPYAGDASQILYGARVAYTVAGGNVVPITPIRILDTRNGTGGYTGYQSVGTTLFAHPTAFGIPGGIIGIVGTLRAYAPTGPGYLTAFPGSYDPGNPPTPPTTSNVNFYPNPSYPTTYAVADEVMVGTASDDVAIYVGGPPGSATHVVFDVGGYVQSGYVQ